MWTAEKVTVDAASKIQVGSGILLNEFSIEAPTEPADSTIIAETTGDFHPVCKPITEDIFEDVNNAPKNTKEGKRFLGWECTFGANLLSITDETIKFALGAADGEGTTGISPREQVKVTDFKKIYWIGNMLEETKLLVIEMDDSLSEGLDLTITNKKGTMAVNIIAHSSFAKPHVVPMKFYILTKQEAA